MDAQIVVRVTEGGADAERLEELAGGLRMELLDLDVNDVTSVRSGEPPPGTRAIELAAVGALLISAKASIEVLEHLVTAVRSWLGRHQNATTRTVELTIGDRTLRMSNASSSQQDRLIEEFIDAIARE